MDLEGEQPSVSQRSIELVFAAGEFDLLPGLWLKSYAWSRNTQTALVHLGAFEDSLRIAHAPRLVPRGTRWSSLGHAITDITGKIEEWVIAVERVRATEAEILRARCRISCLYSEGKSYEQSETELSERIGLLRRKADDLDRRKPEVGVILVGRDEETIRKTSERIDELRSLLNVALPELARISSYDVTIGDKSPHRFIDTPAPTLADVTGWIRRPLE
jgi:hypothetical protein